MYSVQYQDQGEGTSITTSSLPSDNGLQYLADGQNPPQRECSWYLH